CAGLAFVFCPSCACGPPSPSACGNPASRNCFLGENVFSFSTPGCQDCDCCTQVCAIDPTCCSYPGWMQSCADLAVAVCAPCDPAQACPAGALIEPEACGAAVNGGGFYSSEPYTSAACGDTWCGTLWALFGSRDFDYYLICHDGGPISAKLVSQIPT